MNSSNHDAPVNGYPAVSESPAFTRWHLLPIGLLVLGYSGYYFCRSDFSVALPMLKQDLAQHGIPLSTATVRLGSIASAGVLAYAIGKLLCGSLADLFGGRRSFLVGIAGSGLFPSRFPWG